MQILQPYRDGSRSADGFAARIVAREPMPGGLVRIGIEAPREARATYTNPGQYVTVHAGDERAKASFVLANDPGSPIWELVVRPAGRVASALAGDGTDSVAVSRALGAGFPLDTVRGKALVVAVTGSGMGAARAIVRARIEASDGPNTRLYIGVRTRADIPFPFEIESWLARGCGVVGCLSRQAVGAHAGRARLRLTGGHVQDTLSQDLLTAPATSIFVVGSNAMLEAIRGLAPALSMRRDDVLSNH